MADRVLPILIRSNLIRVITHLISILSWRVRNRLAELFFENEEITELFSDEVGNLRVCFGFTSNYSAHLRRTRDDRFFSIQKLTFRKTENLVKAKP